MLKYLVAAACAATIVAPAAAEDAPRTAFDGFHVEAIVGSDSDPFYGAALGYDLRRGRAVFGIENELDLADAKRCITLDISVNDRLCQRRQHDIYAGGRIGIVAGPGTLIYAKAGYTNLRLGESYDGGSGGGSFRYVEKLDGVRVGAGIEQRVSGSLFVKGEYRYSDYERGSYKHDAVIGIGFRF